MDVMADLAGRPRSAAFEMKPLPLAMIAATIAPVGTRYLSNAEGIFRAEPGSLEFALLHRLDLIGVEPGILALVGYHGLHHDPAGGIYLSVRGGQRLWRMPRGEAEFHVVSSDLGGMLRGFDYHMPTGLLLAGRYSERGPARLLSSRDGEQWSVLREWDARHIHDVRVNPANDWIYVLVGEGDPRDTADSHAVYRSKDGLEFTRLFKRRRPFFLSVNFYRSLVILGTDHPEGNNGIFAFDDDGTAGPVRPTELFRIPELHRSLAHGPPFVHFLEWLEGSLFAGIRGKHLAFLLRTSNLLDWEIVHLARAPRMAMPYVACSRQPAEPYLLVSGEPGLLISVKAGAELYGLPVTAGRSRAQDLMAAGTRSV